MNLFRMSTGDKGLNKLNYICIYIIIQGGGRGEREREKYNTLILFHSIAYHLHLFITFIFLPSIKFISQSALFKVVMQPIFPTKESNIIPKLTSMRLIFSHLILKKKYSLFWKCDGAPSDSSHVSCLLHLQLPALRPSDPPHHLDLLYRQDSIQGQIIKRFDCRPCSIL